MKMLLRNFYLSAEVELKLKKVRVIDYTFESDLFNEYNSISELINDINNGVYDDFYLERVEVDLIHSDVAYYVSKEKFGVEVTE